MKSAVFRFAILAALAGALVIPGGASASPSPALATIELIEPIPSKEASGKKSEIALSTFADDGSSLHRLLGRSGIDPDAAAKARLGLTYGPFMGLRCSHPVAKADCERIGIDIVLRRPATAVVAVAGDQRIILHTPGKHDGVRHRDWVGTFTEAGIAPGSYPPGTNVARVGVEIRVRFADGRRARARFHHVLLAPGWG